jgi:Ion channel
MGTMSDYLIRFAVRFTSGKYNLLLSVLVLSFFIYPFGYNNIVWEALLFTIFTGIVITIVSVIYQLQPHKRTYRLYMGLAGLVLCLEIVRHWSISSRTIYLSIVIHHLILIFLMASSAIVIIREIFSASQVTSDTIKGGVCVYLLAGIAWSYLYNLLLVVQPESFDLMSSSNIHDDLLYFSFVTLTTVGYGDILPISPLARVCANLESIVGVLYPSIYIARLVGQYSSEKPK